MGLASLEAALAGLRVAQRQLDVTSNNIGNVNTQGYTRKILPQGSQVIEGEVVAVNALNITRRIDLGVQRSLWTQISSTNFYDIQSTYLQRIDQFHGNPTDGISVAAEISKLRDEFSALADIPNDTSLLSSVLDQAQDVAGRINDFAALLNTLRNDTQNDIIDAVDRINDLLDTIATSNEDVKFAAATGRSTAASEDARDAAIQELTTLMGITTFRRGDGVLVVQTTGGVELASDRVSEISFNPLPVSATTYYPESAAGIIVSFPGSAAQPIDITSPELGGKLGGLI